jgi:hypothetical protein
MKFILTEEQVNFLLEASKKDVLIQKVGFSEENATELDNLAGPLSVWLGNKLIDNMLLTMQQAELPDATKPRAIKLVNDNVYVRQKRNEIQSIMDWIRVGLNGNVNQYRDLSFVELFENSKKWHDELGVGEGDINYKEENEIIRDYRKDGVGFYWVNLETSNSPEECNRMGHCGRTNSSNTIYSLRETKQLNQKYTLNKSHLTAAVGNDDGIIYQLKGPKNSKPTERFHPYIMDLLLHDEHIKGFGSEYASSQDFSILDLGEDDVREIYRERPELFNDRKSKRALAKLGIIDNPKIDTIFDLELEPGDVRYYVDNDYTVRKYKDQRGNTREIGMFETLLSGDVWDLFDGGYSGDWKNALEYYVDSSNTEMIWNIVKQYAEDKEFNLENVSLVEAIDELDDNYEIQNALSSALTDAESDSSYEYYMKQLKSALEEIGEVIKMNDEGVTLRIDLQKVIDDVSPDEDDLDEMYDRCDDSPECVFRELIGDYYDKPNFYVDSRWSPDVNENYFNEVLYDRLSDIR